jgi:hypothetical protein
MKTKRPYYLMLTLIMVAGLSTTSCVQNDNPIVADVSSGVQSNKAKEPTIDRMGVLVTADVPTAVIGTFDEGTTGASLVKRLPKTTASIDADTRMVILSGSMFDNMAAALDPEVMKAAVRLTMDGGYICLTNPTNEQAGVFGLTYLLSLLALEETDIEQLFDITSEEATEAAQSSPRLERMKMRMANMQRVARTRADDEDMDMNAPFAEMIILGSNDYFMQEPFEENFTSYVSESDENGNSTDPQVVTGKMTRTAAISGMLADAAAQWLNDTEKSYQQAAARRTMTRASGSSNINELMNASETFTYNGDICFTDDDASTRRRYNRVNMKVSSWGVHNIDANKDYYYLKQNVTLCMGDRNGSKIFYPTRGENYWYTATNFGEYNRWYGAFLSKYATSMDLTGSGSIHLEAAAPNTDNNSSTTTVTTGTSHSTTETVGITWGASAGANASGPMGSFSVGGSYSVGTTNGSSFSVGMSQTTKELGVKKNTVGTKVAWTYTGALPQYYEREGDYIYYCHQTPAAILVNDADVSQEICWSVDNPSGQYTVNITSSPQTAVLVYVYKNEDGYENAPRKYVYNNDADATYTHNLLEPNRAMQSWRMYITIDEWVSSPIVGAQGELESNIRNAFPDLYASTFRIADKTATSLNTIGYIVKASKEIMTNNVDILQSYARSWGIKKFTIHWRCDDRNVTTREGLTIIAD